MISGINYNTYSSNIYFKNILTIKTKILKYSNVKIATLKNQILTFLEKAVTALTNNKRVLIIKALLSLDSNIYLDLYKVV
jgi:hypothetical protein